LHSKNRVGKYPKKWVVGTAFVGLIFMGTLSMNTLWLSSFSQVDDNIRQNRWLDPIDDVPACSKLMTKIWVYEECSG
jgi:hypothetical protein